MLQLISYFFYKTTILIGASISYQLASLEKLAQKRCVRHSNHHNKNHGDLKCTRFNCSTPDRSVKRNYPSPHLRRTEHAGESGQEHTYEYRHRPDRTNTNRACKYEIGESGEEYRKSISGSGCRCTHCPKTNFQMSKNSK